MARNQVRQDWQAANEAAVQATFGLLAGPGCGDGEQLRNGSQ
jgi:hypothetical protein